MRVLFEREPLLRGCRLGERLLPNRTPDPGRTHVLVRACRGGLELHAAGSEAGLRLELPAEVEQTGEVLLPTQQTTAILRQSDAEVLRLDVAPGTASLLAEGARFDLVVPEASLGRAVEPFPAGPHLRLNAEALCRSLRRTLFATGEPSSRYAFHAVQWEVEPQQVRIVTSDSL